MKHLSLLVLSFVILFGCNNINELTQTDALSQNNKQKSSLRISLFQRKKCYAKKKLVRLLMLFTMH